MVRFKLGLLIALLALIAAEPLIHNHPLIPEGTAPSQSLCAVCASGPARVTLSTPTVAAPTVVVWSLDVCDTTFVERSAALPLASRAPPAA